MITQVTYARTFNLGNYESLRLEAVATVDDDAPMAAFEQARIAVEAEYALMMQKVDASDRREAEYAPPPASDKQRAFIATLQDKIGWSSEQFATYAAEQNVDLITLTRPQASELIDQMQKLAKEERIIDWSKRVSGAPQEKPGTVGNSAEIPF